mgnify:CR=1 FL=1
MFKKAIPEFAKHGFVWFILFFAFFPFYLMVVISFKSNQQFTTNPFGWSRPLMTENWVYGWNIVGGLIANSIVVAICAVILTLSCALMAAYVFGRYKFPGSNILWYALLSLLMLPAVANLIPLYFILKNLQLLNTLVALFLVGAAVGQVMCIFVLRNFIEDIPGELFEAAEIDGAGHVQRIKHVVLPMCAPIIGTLAIMQFLANWNNFILPLLVLADPNKYTIPVGIMMLQGEYDKQWGKLMAAYVIASIPLVILFIFTMRLFVRGLARGAIKG